MILLTKVTEVCKYTYFGKIVLGLFCYSHANLNFVHLFIYFFYLWFIHTHNLMKTIHRNARFKNVCRS